MTPELLSGKQVAQLLSISPAHFFKLKRTGRLGPMPVRLGRCVRYRRAEILAWIDAGVPSRHKWEILRSQK